MNRTEINNLFIKWLKRMPSESEASFHMSKDATSFEDELKNCEEYKKMTNNKLNNPKIAFCISGHIRKNKILDSIKKFCNNNDYDIFIHTWDTVGIKGSETKLDKESELGKVKDNLKKFSNIKSIIIENNPEYINKIKNDDRHIKYFNFSSPERFIKSQLYSINKSYNLLVDYKNKNNINYDIVFRLRFDSEFLNFNLSRALVDDIINNKIIFLPNKDNQHSHPDHGTSCWACDKLYYNYNYKDVHIFDHTNVICDTFAYGSFSSMSKYFDLYNNYDSILKGYEEKNIEMMNKRKGVNTKVIGKDVSILKHADSLYYYYCSYPERLLQFFLNEYMLVESRMITVKHSR